MEGHGGYWDIAEFAERAEYLGLDRVTIGEHIMDLNPPRPTLLSIPAMACAAGATRTLRVMTGIVIAPLYDSLVLSKLVSTLDVISKGRVDFGIGISGQRETQVEFEAVGISVRTRGRRSVPTPNWSDGSLPTWLIILRPWVPPAKAQAQYILATDSRSTT